MWLDGPDNTETQHKMAFNNKLAFAISAISSPFLVTMVTAGCAVWALKPTWNEFLLWGSVTALFSALIPLLCVYLLWRARYVTDIHVSIRHQRLIPFTVTILSGVGGVMLLHKLGAPNQLVALGLTFIANAILLIGITLFWKISIHSATLVAAIFTLSLLITPWILCGLITVPAVMWARIHRQRHTLMQGIVPVIISAILTPSVYLSTLALLLLYSNP